MASPKTRKRHCFNCGAEIGDSAYYERFDTCGQRECEREARAAQRQARSEADEHLDRDMGY